MLGGISLYAGIARRTCKPNKLTTGFNNSMPIGAIHKGRLQRGKGGGVAQKRTNADKGRGGSRQSGRPQQKKIIFNYLIVASLNEVLNRN